MYRASIRATKSINMSKNVAIDLGSSSARVILIDNTDSARYKEVARFPHEACLIGNSYKWDIDGLFSKIIGVIDELIDKESLSKIGICSWGVDYAVVSEKGLDVPFSYRDDRTSAPFEAFHNKISKLDYFKRTGIYPSQINTIYQLLSDDKSRYDNAKGIVMMADSLAYKLTGSIAIERSNASTTGLLTADGKDWDYELIDSLNINRNLFPKIIDAGEMYGEYRGVKVVACLTHDTASALYSMPLNERSAFLSSGSWLLFGRITEASILNEQAYNIGFTNEKGFGNQNTLLRNINGLFVIQRLQKELNVTYQEIDREMPLANVLGIVNTDLLLHPYGMVEAVKKELKVLNAGPFDIIKSVYYSLAYKIKEAKKELQELTGEIIDNIVITGGATRAPYFIETLREMVDAEIIISDSEGAIAGIDKCLRD